MIKNKKDLLSLFRKFKKLFVSNKQNNVITPNQIEQVLDKITTATEQVVNLVDSLEISMARVRAVPASIKYKMPELQGYYKAWLEDKAELNKLQKKNQAHQSHHDFVFEDTQAQALRNAEQVRSLEVRVAQTPELRFMQENTHLIAWSLKNFQEIYGRDVAELQSLLDAYIMQTKDAETKEGLLGIKNNFLAQNEILRGELVREDRQTKIYKTYLKQTQLLLNTARLILEYKPNDSPTHRSGTSLTNI